MTVNTSDRPKFWTRVAQALRLKSRNHPPVVHWPELGEDGLLAEPAEFDGDTMPEEVSEVESVSDGDSSRPSKALARWAKRDQTLAKLQEGYEQVTELVEQIRNHLHTQDERSERICNSLEQLARSMSDMPELSRQQSEQLAEIAARVQASHTDTKKLSESLGELPKVSRAQSNTLNNISRQLEMTNEQNVVASQTMDKLGTAISMLGESNQSQAEVLRRMDAKSAEHNETMNHLVASQGKRFMALFIVTMVLVAAAITLGGIALAMRG